MNQVKDSYKLYKCETCGNQISAITKQQQNSPSSLLWSRYGLCSPGCLATESKLRKEDVTLEKGVRQDRGRDNISQLNRFENQSNDAGSERGPDVDIMFTKKNSWQRVISCGKIGGGLAFATGLIFYYSDFITGAFICLAFGILCIVLCRIGVWNKCRIK